jgi:hypothetical protein
MRVGFTGTQEGMTAKQKAEVAFWLRNIADGQSFAKDPVTLHHGGCIGADAEAHDLAAHLGYRREVHPALVDVSKQATLTINEDGDVVARPRSPLDRNKDIVDRVDVLIAAPRQRKEVMRSGTWHTVRYAAKVGRTTIMVWP